MTAPIPSDLPADSAAPARLRIALIAHDGKKDEMVMLATEFADFLGGCELIATGTTGLRLTAEVGLAVERMLSGPHGGDLRDPMTPQPHEPDINALVRACDVHDVACATNVASGRLMLRSLQVLGASGGGRE